VIIIISSSLFHVVMVVMVNLLWQIGLTRVGAEKRKKFRPPNSNPRSSNLTTAQLRSTHTSPRNVDLQNAPPDMS
jgi:hypothetical protein